MVEQHSIARKSLSRQGWMRRGWALLISAICLIGATGVASSEEPLARQIEIIDRHNPGGMGVYVKQLRTGRVYAYRANRPWYLASLVKVPLGIAVLQNVEKGRLSLDDELVLRESDYVDGTGDLLNQKTGTRHSVRSLLEQSIEHSDSTATDMLMRHIGVDRFNRQVREAMVPQDLGPFSTILQVRYDAYGELHAGADKLSNLDYVRIRSAGGFPARVKAFRKMVGIKASDLQVSSLEEAFERYYQRQQNTGTLEAAGTLLERLVRGELLNKNHTRQLLTHMERITTGDKRLKAGLPAGTPFAQKTGTQIERACNMGVAHPGAPEKAVVMVVCVQGFGDRIEAAEKVFRQVGQALNDNEWL